MTIVDRILEAPSVWQMCLSPLLLWLTIHIDDGLFHAILAKNNSLKTELARLHNLTAVYCKQESRKVETGAGIVTGEKRLEL